MSLLIIFKHKFLVCNIGNFFLLLLLLRYQCLMFLLLLHSALYSTYTAAVMCHCHAAGGSSRAVSFVCTRRGIVVVIGSTALYYRCTVLIGKAGRGGGYGVRSPYSVTNEVFVGA
jgi:hypothetical protein